MLIRSQDKMALIPIDKIKIDNEKSFSNEKMEYSTIWCGEDDVIGEYSTKEKALKVLDMIQEKYIEHINVSSDVANLFAFVPPKVFKMPQDSEVI